MRHDRFESFLWGELLLFALLGATLGLFLSYPSLRTPYELPELKLVLATVFMLAGALVAVLSATRFRVEGRRFDLLLCAGFSTTAVSWLAFTVVPGIVRHEGGTANGWAAVAGPSIGWSLIALAPFSYKRVQRRRAALSNALGLCCLGLVVVGVVSNSLGDVSLTGVFATQALLQLVGVIGFTNRYRLHGKDLNQWLAVATSLALFSSLGRVFSPSVEPQHVARSDFLLLIAYGVLLVGVWRAIRDSEFGRAVAEERARVAREIHDGLAQYLFTIATHTAMLESGADPAKTLPQLKQATLAAQQEARYAILALSSASGRSPFDTALRRYVDVLTADGMLEVELEIDPQIQLGPDEQIEVFRIVQEGLANARRHADARHAWVQIGARSGDRYVSVRDDGGGFEPGGGAGQGLRNMRDRAESIGGALSLRSAPGFGTLVEVVLRA
jgi:signal transduction histidine kinase